MEREMTPEITRAVMRQAESSWSEVELAYRFISGRLIGVTGSNGKTTTTMLVDHILRKENLNVGMGGNIGDSFALQVAENDFDIHVHNVLNKLDYKHLDMEVEFFKSNLSSGEVIIQYLCTKL